MEVKKKFEKPQMEVVQLKPAGIICDSCPTYWCKYDCPLFGQCSCDDDCLGD